MLKLLNRYTKEVEKDKKSIIEQKRFMWENLSDYTDEERSIEMYEVDRNVDITNMQINRINKYQRALNSPYFGKMEFKDDSDTKAMPIYIGISSVQDNLNFLVYDWRAPISSLFYNYELGKAKYEVSDNEITGEILSKMQFKIVDGELVRCFKSNVNIDDDYLQEILANTSSNKMKNIVSTIQREQNEIIRNDKDRYLIVQGVAGSGKTSVALHRVAYLLYKDINLNSNNILIFSPNDIFSDYISNVLPELGENNVLKATFNDFASKYIKIRQKVESYSDFLQRVYKKVDNQNNIIKYKMSDEYKTDLDTFLNDYERSIKFNKGFNIKSKAISNIELQLLFSEKYKKLSLTERIERIAEYICLQFNISVKKHLNTIKGNLYESCGETFNYYDVYQRFLNSSYFRINNDEKQNIDESIKYEDIIGLLYTYVKINGYERFSNIRHVVIDEVQDYTLFQIEMLKEIFNQASFTILGDISQTINPYYKYESLSKISDIFTTGRYIELFKTYRSTEEIIDYSNRILGINNSCSVRRGINIPVDIKNVSQKEMLGVLKQDLIDMHKYGIDKIAIITKNVNQAVNLYKILSNNIENLQLISSSNISVKNSIVIIPSYLSKGLEFDGVIVYNEKNNNYNEKERNLYYVVCTRAQHKLNIYNEPTNLLIKR